MFFFRTVLLSANESSMKLRNYDKIHFNDKLFHSKLSFSKDGLTAFPLIVFYYHYREA